MYTAIGGLRNQQIAINVTANNIANSTTIGYKTQRASFQEMMAQTLRGASAPIANGTGGSGPMQVGLGMNIQGITTVATQGSMQTTGQWSDLAINGEGYFCIADAVDTAGGGALPAQPTINFSRAGNFNTDAAGYMVTSDGKYLLGRVATAQNPLAYGTALNAIQVPPSASNVTIDQQGTVSYDLNGTHTVAGQICLAKFPNPGGLGRIGGNLLNSTPNSGIFDPTISAPTVNNDPYWTPANTAGVGMILGGTLEMSNVDLGEQFTNMIVAERAFQSNARVITTSDEILQDLVNIKR